MSVNEYGNPCPAPALALRKAASVPWSASEDLAISIAEAVTVLVKGRRWNRRLVEARVAIDVRRSSGSYVTPCGIRSVMESLLNDFGVCGLGVGGRRRWVIRSRLWMGASCQRQGQQQR